MWKQSYVKLKFAESLWLGAPVEPVVPASFGIVHWLLLHGLLLHWLLLLHWPLVWMVVALILWIVLLLLIVLLNRLPVHRPALLRVVLIHWLPIDRSLLVVLLLMVPGRATVVIVIADSAEGIHMIVRVEESQFKLFVCSPRDAHLDDAEDQNEPKRRLACICLLDYLFELFVLVVHQEEEDVHHCLNEHDQNLAKVHRCIAHVVNPNDYSVEQACHRVKEHGPAHGDDDVTVENGVELISDTAQFPFRLNDTIFWRRTANGAAWVLLVRVVVLLTMHL